MRMRTRKNLSGRLDLCRDLMLLKKDDFVSFVKDAPVHLEIGCGKGRFITETAKLYPDVRFVAVEHIPNVAILAMEKARTEGLFNVRFCVENVAFSEILPDSSLDRIYLNFSDPWPKKGHAKRRLTHPSFLALYKKWLKPCGEIHFKTDNAKLFEYSLNTFCEAGFKLSNITFDLHNSDFSHNVMTEYEMRFSEQGYPIYRLEARK